MHCQLRSADRTFFDGPASMIVARSARGEFAIMEGHAPLLAVLDRGAVRIHTDGETRVFACHTGTLRTTGDHVSLLVESATPVEEIDLSEIQARIAQSEVRLSEGADRECLEEKEHLDLLRTVKERYG